MSIKERVKSDVEKIIAKEHQVEDELIAFVKRDYAETLDDVGKGMDTVKETTLEYLEGVEEGLKAAGHKSGKLVSKAAEAIVEVSSDLGDKGVDAAGKIAVEAKTALNTALEKAKGSIDNVEEKTKNQIKDAHACLNEVGEAGKARLEGVGEGIKAYAVRKKGDLSDSARQALSGSVDRSKELVRKLAGSTEAQSKELLSHSLEKVSGWLGKLADKVKPKS